MDTENQLKTLERKIDRVEKDGISTSQKLSDHILVYANNGKEIAKMAERIGELRRAIDSLADASKNHNKMSAESEKGVSADHEAIQWLKKGFWVMAGALVGVIIRLIFTG